MTAAPFVGWQRQDNGPSVQGALEDGHRETFRRARHGHRRGPHRCRRACPGPGGAFRPGKDIRAGQGARRAESFLRPDPVVVLDAAVADERIPCPLFRHGAALSVSHPQPPQPAGAGRWPGLACRRPSWMPRPCMPRRSSWWASMISPPSAPPNARPSRRSRLWTGWMSAGAAKKSISKRRRASFLHHQIRSFAGTLKLVGEGKWTAARCRRRAGRARPRRCGPVAPPDGLYLVRVDYF